MEHDTLYDLGLALVSIFVGYYREMKLFYNTTMLFADFRYVDDIFAVFNNEEECDSFLTHLNYLYSSFWFTCEKESNRYAA